jgi:hypothetical protein
MDVRREDATVKHWETVIADSPAPCLDTAVGVPLIDLEIGQCLWPTIDQKAFPSYLFCGAPVESGSSYCGYHGREAFVRRR